MARLPHQIAAERLNGCSRSRLAINDKRHWMGGIVKHPGALHRELGIPAGQRIPEKKLEAAEHSPNPTERKRAVLAETFRKSDHHKS